MDVSIIFVNYKTRDLTINAIKSVFEKTQGINFEIFVVDNNSQDGSIEAIEKEFPNINIIKNTINAGFGAANNLAIKQARGKYILCLNTDTLLINNAIKIMYDFMEKEQNQNVGACGGQLFDLKHKKQASVGHYMTIQSIIFKPLFSFIKPLSLKYENLINPKYYCPNMQIDNIHGANIFLRTSVLSKIGTFDETFFMYEEDTDLCKRISDAGYKLKYVKDAEITHLEGGSYSVKLEKQKQCIKSLFLYYKKHYKSQLSFLKFIYILGYLNRFILGNHQNGREMLKFVIKL